MDFFLKNLEDTLEAINKLIENSIHVVNTKKIRRCNNVKSSNRSKINFIWRSLKYLEEAGILERNGAQYPVTYKIKTTEKINISNFLDKIENERKNSKI
ncbi:MAG: hypothetical protein ACTSXH_17595 [Promethearchaeota archaeon]